VEDPGCRNTGTQAFTGHPLERGGGLFREELLASLMRSRVREAWRKEGQLTAGACRGHLLLGRKFSSGHCRVLLERDGWVGLGVRRGGGNLRVGGSIAPGASAVSKLMAPTVSAIRAEANPVTETMSPAPATSRSIRPVPERFQILVSFPSSPTPPACVEWLGFRVYEGNGETFRPPFLPFEDCWK